MRYEILLAPEAVEDLKGLRAHERTQVRAALEMHLRTAPRKVSKSRIKRLQGLSRPQFRLRIGDLRIFYDVESGRSRSWRLWPRTMRWSGWTRRVNDDEEGSAVRGEG